MRKLLSSILVLSGLTLTAQTFAANLDDQRPERQNQNREKTIVQRQGQGQGRDNNIIRDDSRKGDVGGRNDSRLDNGDRIRPIQ